ncbi:hypothetical protein SAMN05216368_12615 [Cryobacterium flavum]|uniref:Uncharacterized protein n=1 Tax=Cryobacterium flavum TaxID=1424659 RepID=A0A5E9G3T0_9MICO|nr:hypothetical protein SAMN05216368_12615 [Cryobacterium flavum]
MASSILLASALAVGISRYSGGILRMPHAWLSTDLPEFHLDAER